MNKYQLKALEYLHVLPEEFGHVVSDKTGRKNNTLRIDENNAVVVCGDRDIFSKDYSLRLFVGLYVKVEVLINGKWVSCENANHQYTEKNTQQNFNGVLVSFNLDKRPEKIKLIIPNKVCDDIVLDVNYDLMSEEEYWRVQNSPETLRNNMAVSFRTGENLVNIYWKHAKENVVTLVRIDLYMGTPASCQLMGKYKVNDEVFFKSIDGLAFGKYCFKIFQFDKDNNEIASTDFIEFSLNKPTGFTSGGGGLHGHKGIVIG